jgi:hypothetical protein
MLNVLALVPVAAQRLLEELPNPPATQASVLVARPTALRVFLREAPKIATEHVGAWPDELADAVLTCLRIEGVPIEDE